MVFRAVALAAQRAWLRAGRSRPTRQRWMGWVGTVRCIVLILALLAVGALGVRSDTGRVVVAGRVVSGMGRADLSTACFRVSDGWWPAR